MMIMEVVFFNACLESNDQKPKQGSVSGGLGLFCGSTSLVKDKFTVLD